MPQMSGPELAKRLASARPHMKVLCMSGYTDDSIVRHGVLAAHIAFLQKPITPDTLTARVREVLDGAPSGSTG
jgi:two-component system, cell cycle sensor histidine kinase and response regulator CckA